MKTSQQIRDDVAESPLGPLIDSLPAAIWEVDAETLQPTYCNRRALELLRGVPDRPPELGGADWAWRAIQPFSGSEEGMIERGRLAFLFVLTVILVGAASAHAINTTPYNNCTVDCVGCLGPEDPFCSPGDPGATGGGTSCFVCANRDGGGTRCVTPLQQQTGNTDCTNAYDGNRPISCLASGGACAYVVVTH